MHSTDEPNPEATADSWLRATVVSFDDMHCMYNVRYIAKGDLVEAVHGSRVRKFDNGNDKDDESNKKANEPIEGDVKYTVNASKSSMKVNAESTKRGMKATRHVRINKGDTVQEQLSCLQDQHDAVTTELNNLRRLVYMIGKYIQYETPEKQGYAQISTYENNGRNENNIIETRIDINSVSSAIESKSGAKIDGENLKKKRDTKNKRRRNGKSTFQLILIKSALGPKGSCRKGINLERGYFALIDSIAVFFC